MKSIYSKVFRRCSAWGIVCVLAAYCGAIAKVMPSVTTTGIGEHTPVFIENKGQWNTNAAFCLSTRAVDVWCNPTSIVYDYRQTIIPCKDGQRTMYKATGQVVRMEFEHALAKPTLHGQYGLTSVFHYFLGKDTSKWQSNVRGFSEVVYNNVYHGVDIRLYSDKGRPRYDVVVHPGGVPSDVVLAFTGMEAMRVEERDVYLGTAGSDVVQGGLYAYQLIDGIEHEVQCRFVDKGHGRVGFDVGAYNPAYTLVLDPLVYSTFIGGTLGDEAFGIARDNKNNTYVVGTTFSLNYPFTTGAYDTTKQLAADIIVSKLRASGDDLVYSTFIGGDGDDYGYDIAVDSQGEAAITGYSFSADFPMTAQTWDRTLGGDRDIIVVRLSSDGSRLKGSTYLGGNSWDEGYSIALDGAGNMYITGMTTSIDFPTVNAYDDSHNGAQDVVVAALNPSATNLLYGSFLGGASSDQGNAIAIDGSGAIYIGGSTGSSGFPTVTGSFDQTFNGSTGTVDGFIAKLSGSSLVYSTFLGGAGNDEIWGLALDAQNNVYVGGQTSSSTPSFPITLGAFDNVLNGVDAFLARLDATGALLLACTYTGQDNVDVITDVAVDANRSVYATGYTQSSSFPTTTGAFDDSYNGGDRDAFVVKYSPSFNATSLLYSTYVGGNNYDEGKALVVDEEGGVYITGITRSGNFPTTLGVYNQTFGGLSDAYIAKIGTATPALALSTPGGGEAWCTGTKAEIAWTSRSVTYVRIELSTNAGISYTVVLADTVPAARERWTWNIPPTFAPGTEYRIRVVSLANNTLLSACKDNFSIYAAPTLAMQPRDVVACIGEGAVFRVGFTAFPAATMQWEVSSDNGKVWQSVPAPAGQQNPLVVPNVQLVQHQYLYRIVLSNICNKSGLISSTATLLVRSQPKVLSAPKSIVLCSGGEGMLSVDVDEPGVRYQWRRNGQPISGANGRQLTLRNAQAATAGQYDVVITGACPPNVISTAATVSVQLPLDIAKSPVFRNVLCAGETRDTTLVLANNGPLDVDVSVVAITNPRFSVVSPSGNFTVASGQTKTLVVRFTPQSARIETGQLVLATQPCNSEIRVSMGARADSVRIAASDIILPPLYQCDKERTAVVRIVNTGSIVLPIVRATFSHADFSLVSPKPPFSIQPEGRWIDAVVRFTDAGGSDNPIQTTVSFASDTCAGIQAEATLTIPRVQIDFVPSQAQIDLGELSFCGTHNDASFLVFNRGTTTVHIDSMALDNTAFGVVEPVSAFDIRPNDSRQVTVRFTGGGGGTTTGTLTLFEDKCRIARSVKLRGRKTDASLAAGVVSVDIGSYLSCAMLRDTTILLTNYDAETVTVESVDIALPFVVVAPSLPIDIRSGETYPVTIRFVPSVDGAFTNQAVFHYKTPRCSSSVSIALAASRYTPSFALTPESIASLALEDCEAFKDTAIIVRNTGKVTLTLQRANGAPSVRMLSALPRSIAPGDADTVFIRVEPISTSDIAENLQLHFVECDSVFVVPIRAHKQGIVYTLTTAAETDTLWFDDITSCSPQQQTKQMLIRVVRENSSTVESSVSLVALQPSQPFVVSLVSGTKLQLKEQEFDVVFSPVIDGEFTAVLSLTFMPCGTVRTLVLKGRKVRALVQPSSADIDFGIVQEGSKRTRSIVLRNTGTAPVTMDGVSVPPPFAIESTKPVFPAHLAPGDSIVVEVYYTAGEGKQEAVLLVHISQPCTDSIALAVRGEGKNLPTTVLSAIPKLDFGDVQITTQKMRAVVVKNTGVVNAVVNTTLIFTGADATVFSVKKSPAADISPGDSTTIDIAFAPITQGVKNAMCTIEYNGVPLNIVLVGRGVDNGGAQSVVFLPDTNATPFTRGIRLPLVVIPGTNFSFAAVDSFTAEVRCNASLFSFRAVENARLLRDTTLVTPDATERVITVRGRHSSKPELCVLIGDVLLGDALSTPLALSFSWDNAAGVAQSRSGSLTLIGVDSSQLVYSKGIPGIVSVVPNPSSASAAVLVQTIEDGEHVLELFDATGKEVWSTSWQPLAGQNKRRGIQHTLFLPSSSIATGIYTLRFRAPGGYMHSRSIIVVH